MSAHRYYRLTATATGSGANVEIAALALKIRGGADAAAIKNAGTASASATDAGSDPENAFDNDPATAWLAGAAPGQSITFDFGAGSTQDVVAYAITAAATATHAPTAWTLEHSDDGSAWTERDSQTGITIADGATHEVGLNTHRVNGVATVDEAPASRIVRAYAKGSGELLGETISDPADGSYSLTFPEPAGGSIMVTAHDDWGAPWTPGTAKAQDEQVIPNTANGHYYRAQGAGTTGASEPAWPTDGGTVNDNDITWVDEGTIRAAVVEYPFVPVEI